MRGWYAPIIILALTLPLLSQTPAAELRVTGESAAAAGVTAATAADFARVDARRKLIERAADHLRSLPEVKSMQLTSFVEAYAAAALEAQEQGSRTASAGNRQSVQVDLTARLDAPAIERILILKKDREASKVLVGIWKEIQALYRDLEAPGKTAEQRQTTLTRLRVKHLNARTYGAMAKTEESPASRREPSEEGLNRAESFAKEAVALEPRSADAHTALGDVLLELEEFDEAEAEFRKVIAANPQSSSGHVRLGNALRLQVKFPEAIAAFREALRIDPNSAAAHSDLGLTFGTQRNVNDAMTEYRAAIRLDPDSIDAHNGLAVALAGQRKMSEAVVEFREMVRIDPDLAIGHYNLSIALADLDEDAESAAELREVLRINPNHYNAHYNLGELLRLEGKYDDSARQFREYLRLAPVAPQTQRNRERAQDLVRQYEEPPAPAVK